MNKKVVLHELWAGAGSGVLGIDCDKSMFWFICWQKKHKRFTSVCGIKFSSKYESDSRKLTAFPRKDYLCLSELFYSSVEGSPRSIQTGSSHNHSLGVRGRGSRYSITEVLRSKHFHWTGAVQTRIRWRSLLIHQRLCKDIDKTRVNCATTSFAITCQILNMNIWYLSVSCVSFPIHLPRWKNKR